MPWKIFDRKSGTLSNDYNDSCIARNHCASRNSKMPEGEAHTWQQNRFILLPYGDSATKNSDFGGTVEYRIKLLMNYMFGQIPFEVFIEIFDATKEEIQEAKN